MPILGAEHDLAHPVESESAWSESYYFNGYDAGQDVGFFTRIGVRPHEGTMDVGCSVWLPGDEIAHVLAVRECHAMTDTDLAVGGVRYERIEPMRAWRITVAADGFARDTGGSGGSGGAAVRPARVEMDVRFDARTPAIGVDGQRGDQRGASAASGATVGKGHLEQAGRWSGWIECDAKRWELGTARGNRDKSWGPRRWGGPQAWRWFSINVDDDTHFGGIRITTGAGDLHRGWVWRDGEATSIRRWQIETELADDALTQRVVHVRATDKRDREHVLRGDVLRVAPVHHRRDGRHTVVLEGLTRWEYEGRAGSGIAEYLHQLDDAGRPVVPIS